MNIKVKKSFLLAMLVSIGFMIFLLMRVEWQQFSLIAGRVNVKYLIAACGVFVFANFVRASRFSKLDHMDNTLIHWWNINAFYNFITATLPGGAGEASTAYVLKRFTGLNLLSAIRILLLSRLMDLFAMSVLFFISALLISDITPYREAAIWISGALFLVSLLAILRSSEQFFVKMMQKLPGQSNIKQRICEKLSELLKISEEQRRNNTFRTTLFQSILMMIGGVVSVHLLLRSFGIDFTPVQSAYGYGIYMIFQILPVQGIAGIGTQAAWWALALHAAGYSAPDAIALGIVLHGTFYVFITIIGITAFLPCLIHRTHN
ncbi:MAG: flippase-like domain-containing protein [Nitrospirae bacterium]|nr:flippase-like domain-containing protein [Nitrospirota bacterium]